MKLSFSAALTHFDRENLILMLKLTLDYMCNTSFSKMRVLAEHNTLKRIKILID